MTLEELFTPTNWRLVLHSVSQIHMMRELLGTLQQLSSAVLPQHWSGGQHWSFQWRAVSAGSNGLGTSSPTCCLPAPPPGQEETVQLVKLYTNV